MKILNKKEIDQFLWDHRGNGCIGIKDGRTDEEGLAVNTAWMDTVTEEEIEVEYDEYDH